MELNPDMPAVVDMMSWWREGGANAELQSLSASYSGGQSITAADNWLFIDQINSGGLGNAAKVRRLGLCSIFFPKKVNGVKERTEGISKTAADFFLVGWRGGWMLSRLSSGK